MTMAIYKGILLDTHIIIWLLNADKKLKKNSISVINENAKNNSLFISSISLWEVGMLVKKDKITINTSFQDYIESITKLKGVRIIDINYKIASQSTELDCHQDPADRFLISTAINNNLSLLTSDQNIIKYSKRKNTNLSVLTN